MSVAKPMSIKLLTGDVLEVSVPADISYRALYQLVHSSLPKGLRPFSIDQLNLMCGDMLVPCGIEPAVLDFEEVYLLLIDAERYYLQIDVYHNTLNVYDRVLLNGLVTYERADYVPVFVEVECVRGMETERVLSEYHLYDLLTERFLDLVDVPLEWIGRALDGDDDDDTSLHLRIPHERHHRSLPEMEAFLLQRINEMVQPSLAGLRALSHRIRKGLEKVDEEWGRPDDLDEDGIPHGLPEDFEA